MANPKPIFSRAGAGESALAQHMSQIFNYMAGGVALSGLAAWLTIHSPVLLALALKGGLIWFIVLIAAAFFLQRAIFSLQPAGGLAVFAGYSAFMGFVLSPLALVYTQSSIASAFFVAALMFVGVSAYGYFTKRSLSGMGTFLIMGVWGLVGASLISIVLSMVGVATGPFNTALNLIAVPLFAGLTAWEVNTIKQTFQTYARDELTRSRLAILQAIQLYISFVNMFISLLSLMGQRR